jgi:cobyrinic acid a,c-diamide synthase
LLQIAKWLGAPVLLVVDCWCLARSAAAVVKGYAEFDPKLPVLGVLLNKVGSTAHGTWLKQALASAYDNGQLKHEVRLLGCLPKVCLCLHNHEI